MVYNQPQQVSTMPQISSKGQLSGKYYRTRSLSQNLQQIFHPNRQSHSRSINNLSAVGGRPQTLDIKKSSTAQQLNIPHQSLPQSPRILIESADMPSPSTYFMIPSQSMHHSKSLNFSSSSHVFPTFNYPINRYEPLYIPSAPSMKHKGYNLGDYRRTNYMRSASMEAQKTTKPFLKRRSWEQNSDRYQINEVIRENSELLRKYSDPKVHDTSSSSSLSLWQSTFKAKLASLFRNKKKYTIMEPTTATHRDEHYNNIPRAYSAQSLPALFKPPTTTSSKKNSNKKKTSKLSQNKKYADGKLKTLNLNPPQMIGGSYDNLLLINKLNKKKNGSSYDTYHGRPLISQTNRLKALYKYRKPSESDDATTLSYEYDSGDMSDSSSMEHSSQSDADEVSSSFSDMTNKSSNRAYRLRMSASARSMPAMKLQRENSKKSNSTYSPSLSLDTPQFSNIPSNSSTFHGRNDYSMMMMQGHKPSASYNNASNNNNVNVNIISTATTTNFNAQMIKNFFTGPGSSNEFPLVSLPCLSLSLYFSFSIYYILNLTHSHFNNNNLYK